MGTGPVISNSGCSGTWHCVAKQTGQCLPTDTKSYQNRSPQLRQTTVDISKPEPLFRASKKKWNVDSIVTIKHISYMTHKYGSNLSRFSRDGPDSVWVSNTSVLVPRKIRFETQYFQGFFSNSFIHSIGMCRMWRFLAFSGASSIPVCYIAFTATLFHQLVFHPPSIHLPSISWSTSQPCCFQIRIQYIIFELYFLPCSVHAQTNVIQVIKLQNFWKCLRTFWLS